ncbi:E3 ubiquitin-protein ligase [Canna indica]|uniref:E3 ubiquitin-protein ligase n=1 Tax=Canna indica TaxID=4628 RepID=A0AAQ3L4Q4_9LILI|nr:E3 ubiquitin-protein ligase [Canna indica]
MVIQAAQSEKRNWELMANGLEQASVDCVVNRSSDLIAGANRRKRGRNETESLAATIEAEAAAGQAPTAAAAAASNLMFWQALSAGQASASPSPMLGNPVAQPSSSSTSRLNLGEVEAYLRAHDEELRRKLSEKWQSHSRALLCAAEAVANRRVQEKEALAEQAMRQCAELKHQLTYWRAMSMAAEHKIASLRAQLEQTVALAAAERTGESPGHCRAAEDAESTSHLDYRSALSPGSCMVCTRENAAVMAVVPCGHLCLCEDCSVSGDAMICPCCGHPCDGTFRVVF